MLIGMPWEVELDPLWEEPLASPFAAPRQNRPAAFGFHARAKAELLFARPLGRLIGAFHRPSVKKERQSRERRKGVNTRVQWCSRDAGMVVQL